MGAMWCYAVKVLRVWVTVRLAVLRAAVGMLVTGLFDMGSMTMAIAV